MASTNTPVPIVLCGAKVALGAESAKFMAPEYEVIHFCASLDSACAEIPRLLSGQPPQPVEDNEVGTHNYSSTPKAIMIGRTYTDDKLEKMREACKDSPEVSWVVPGEPASSNETIKPGHATRVAQNMKDVLDELRNSGKIGQEGLFKYSF